MAAEYTTPHGLIKYGAGTDPIPGRSGHNAMVDQLNAMPAFGIGPLSSRPLPASGLRFWVEESTNKLFVNTGVVWAGIADVGAVTPSGIIIGGSAIEGDSSRAARADHAHPIPLATEGAPGAMSAADKRLIAGTTSAATALALVQRSVNNRFNIGSIGLLYQPVTAADAVRKDYADSLVNPSWAWVGNTAGWSIQVYARLVGGFVELRGIAVKTGTVTPGLVLTFPNDLVAVPNRGFMAAAQSDSGQTATVDIAFLMTSVDGKSINVKSSPYSRINFDGIRLYAQT